MIIYIFVLGVSEDYYGGNCNFDDEYAVEVL